MPRPWRADGLAGAAAWHAQLLECIRTPRQHLAVVANDCRTIPAGSDVLDGDAVKVFVRNSADSIDAVCVDGQAQLTAIVPATRVHRTVVG